MKSKNFLISLVALIASFAGGRIIGSTDIAMIVFCAVIGYWILVTLTALGKKKEVAQIEAKWQQIDAVDKRYKQLAEQLTADHSHEQQTMLASLANGNTEEQTEQLKQQYAEKFEHLRGDYKKEAETILDDAAVKTLRGWRSNYLLIAVLMIGALLFATGSRFHEEAIEAEQFAALTATDAWTSKNIPMPFLQDSLRYVSNPDKVISEKTENELNKLLLQLDKVQDVQSAMIVVNHVDNADVEGFAQTLGNDYGVGRNDRGLLLVMAYGDKRFRIHTGKGLEGDLTDVECGRLQKEYFVPAMKRQMPDSALLYVTRAIMSLLAKKEMPQAAYLTANSDDSQPLGTHPLHYLAALLVWLISLLFMNKRMKWNIGNHAAALVNPFVEKPEEDAESSDDTNASVSDSSSSASCGGTYGGGSFGGGGATTSW